MKANGQQQPYLSLIIPAYNEERRIADTIRVAQEYLESIGEPWELIIVDDGSSDATLDQIRSTPPTPPLDKGGQDAGSVFPPLDKGGQDARSVFPPLEKGGQGGVSRSLRVIAYKPNRGKGYAVRQGVLASRGRFVAFSDVDMSAPLTEFPKLFDALKQGYDVAIGSRAVKGAEIPKHQPLYRELGGKSLNLVIRLLATPGLHDTQCGFKLFRGDIARQIFAQCFINRWGFDVEVLYLARRLGCDTAEIGVKWSHGEDSKLRPFRAALGVVRDVVRMRLHKYILHP